MSQDDTLEKTIPEEPGRGRDVAGPSAAELGRVYRAGDIVGGTYRIEQFIGKGGMGYVFCVKHTVIDQSYALKILPPDQLNETNWRRFQSEGKAIAKLNHQNIVRIYNMGVDRDQCPFYVMDLLHGASLLELVQKTGPVPLAVAIEIFSQLCLGLGYAHKVGIIHRDVKPSNVILLDQPLAPLRAGGQAPTVKIVDFGIAKIIRIDGDSIHGDSIQRITNTGEIFGTPLYMSPEQCMGGTVDARSDIYSLGCTFFETLTGRPPFRGESAMATVIMHMDEEPPSLAGSVSEGQFPQSMEMVLAKMLKKDPRQRYQTMEQVAHDLERVKKGKSVVQGAAAGAEAAPPPLTVRPAPAVAEETARGRDVALLAALMAAAVCLIGWFFISFLGPHAPTTAAVHQGKGGEKAVEDKDDDNSMLVSAFKPIDRFSLGLTADGAYKAYRFPEKISFGLLSWEGHEPVLAKGTVYVPASKPTWLEIDFTQGYAIEQMPQLLRKFNRDDIYCVIFRSADWAKCIKQMGDWTGLKRAIFHKVAMKAAEMPLIDTLTLLDTMEFQSCGYETGALARLKILQKLQRIDLGNQCDEEEVIKALAGSSKLRIFTLVDYPCSARGLSYLAQCPLLECIHINGANLRDQDIMILEKLSHLKQISISKNKLTPRSIAIFSRLKAVQALYLADLDWPPSEIVRLRRAMHGKLHL